MRRGQFQGLSNPTSNIVNVDLGMDNGELGDVEIQLYNVYGKLLDVTNVVGANNHSPLRTEIDMSRYANGVYVLKAVANGKTIGVRKVVRQ
ncbi:MAG: T9SS type A sorting domain-containing protein [Bacteroidales bacterium]|nr:T9SS type A sorting domain-containing protein [Bacteroidales bacterium]